MDPSLLSKHASKIYADFTSPAHSSNHSEEQRPLQEQTSNNNNMEPIIQLPRYRRPLPLEPNTPTRKTMAPTPRDYSSAQHSRSTAPPTPRDSSGGASLLQERLRERKVESARQDRRRSVDMAGGHPQIQSSPVNGSRRREERRPSSSGVTTSKGMGVKQIEDVSSYLLFPWHTRY